jgi:hypothetical protein
MLFGVAGTLAMIWAGLLAARKKAIAYRLGSASWWLKSHLWIGTLSLPLICYHAAFRWGGLLEQLLWATLLVVLASGAVGLVLQNVLPRTMKAQLPAEVIPDQLDYICQRLQAEAEEAVVATCGHQALHSALIRAQAQQPSARDDPDGWLSSYFLYTIRPYLGSNASAGPPLANAQQAERIFERARSTLPDRLHATVNHLEVQCAYRRQLALQARLYRLLHGWLRIHVPLSVALLVFGILHVVSALYY